MSDVHDLEKRLAQIEARNARVELDKRWETSWVRRLSIAVLTYGVISAFLLLLNKEQPFLNAAAPPVGYILSTLVMGGIRKRWQRDHQMEKT